MRFLILCLCLTFLVSTEAHAQQTNVELPDYIKWVKQLDHSEAYIYGGKDVQLRDQHYILEQETSTQLVLVYYRPEDNIKSWFAIYMVLDLSSKELKGYLFDRKSDAWSFSQNLSRNDLDDMATVFKSKYDLEKK